MTKYSEKLVDKIASMIEEDYYTITQICEIVGISRKVFYQWRNEKPAFKQALINAEEAREDRIRILARKALRHNLEGITKIETKKVYIPDKENENSEKLILKEYVVKEKRCESDASVINNTLQNKKEINSERGIAKELSDTFSVYVQNETTKEQVKVLEDKKKMQKNLLVTPDK